MPFAAYLSEVTSPEAEKVPPDFENAVILRLLPPTIILPPLYESTICFSEKASTLSMAVAVIAFFCSIVIV